MLHITSVHVWARVTYVKAATKTCVYYLAEALLATTRNKASVYCYRGTFSTPLVMFACTYIRIRGLWNHLHSEIRWWGTYKERKYILINVKYFAIILELQKNQILSFSMIFYDSMIFIFKFCYNIRILCAYLHFIFLQF